MAMVRNHDHVAKRAAQQDRDAQRDLENRREAEAVAGRERAIQHDDADEGGEE